MANAEMNTVGAFTNDSQSLGGSAPAISSASDASVAENGLPVKARFSMDEAAEQGAGVSKETDEMYMAAVRMIGYPRKRLGRTTADIVFNEHLAQITA